MTGNLSDIHIVAMSENDISNYINILQAESKKPFPKWHIKRALKKIPHQKSKLSNRYYIKFVLNDSNRGVASGRVQCINAETIYYVCGIAITFETYIHVYERSSNESV